MNRLKATLTIHGKIECVTGLHIGGSGTAYEIGGMDNPVIRNPVDGYPYIPGSSLKGKMRSLMEWAEGKVTVKGIYTSSDKDDVICRIFGAPAEANREAGPTRLLVRDALADEETRGKMDELESRQGLPKVEVKTEVNINRVTSKPLSGPRQTERVPVGSKFDFEIVYAIYDVEGLKVRDVDLIPRVFTAMRLVEHSALGGSGSRGYGQVRFLLAKPLIYTLDDYLSGAAKAKDASKLTPLSEFGNKEIEEIQRQVA